MSNKKSNENAVAYLTVPVRIDKETLRDAVFESGLTHDQIAEFILDIDLSVADAGFTEKVIRTLASSLRGDTGDREWQEFMRELAQIGAA